MADEAEVQRVENERIEALLAGDGDRLSSLLAEDLVHFHANGFMDSKASYIDSVTAKLEFLKIERPELKIRLFGDIAVITGQLNQTLRIRDSGAVVEMQGVATQVWVKQSGKWLQNTYHAGRIG